MRVLRTTMWAPDCTANAVIMRDEDLKVSVEEAAKPMPGIFSTSEILEMDDVGHLEATLRAMESMQPNAEREQNMAVLYYHTVQQFRLLADRGHAISKDPAPLSPDEIRLVFEQIAIHPGYRHQTCTTVAEDGATMVILRDGKVLTGNNGVPR